MGGTSGPILDIAAQQALLQMLESKDHWQISDSSSALDLTFAFELAAR
jgi:hypothetical protein